MKKILSLALALVMLLSLASPVYAIEYPGVKGDTPVTAKKGQAPVLKDGDVWDSLGTVYSGNSSANIGNKISANKSYNEIRAEDGTLVGYFTFDKKGNDTTKGLTDNLVITMVSDDYEVVVRWDCSKYYAYAKLDGAGKYSLPQLMQDNGKIQSFDQIWIVSITKKYTPPQLKGEVSIAKHVDGTLIVDSNYGQYFNEDYMSFDLYKVDSKGDTNFGTPVANGDFNMLGTIDFGMVYESGWYAVVETLTGDGEKIFNEAEPVYIYVGENGFKTEDTVIISMHNEYGMVAVNEQVPSVNGQITDYWSAYVNGSGKLDGAVWVWDVENPSATYGVSGSVISLDIDLDLADVPEEVIFYLACDNAASLYVNGEHAYHTSSFITDDYKFEYGCDSAQFHGEQEYWSQLCEWNIAKFLSPGENKITIYAANSAQDDLANAGYNETNNPGGLIFKCVIPGTVFNNTTAKFKSEPYVVPMVSTGYTDATGDWGQALWDGVLNIADNFVALAEYDLVNGFQSAELLDQHAEYIWDKSKDDVAFESENVWTQYGSNCAYFKFEYNLADGAVLDSVVFSDFNIAADNEFALLVNGKLVKISDAFKAIVKVDENTDDIASYFNEESLHSFYSEFIKLNSPTNEYLNQYDWHMIYTICAEDMLQAFLDSGDTDNVVIEIYAYNVPEQILPHVLGYTGNPAMVIFAGSFRYDTKTVVK